MTFRHPELLRAAAPVAPNYAGRCMEDGGFSRVAERRNLPIRVFGGKNDEYWAPGKPFFTQTTAAKQTAAQHGYENVSEVVVPGRGHEAMPAEVLAFFRSLLR